MPKITRNINYFDQFLRTLAALACIYFGLIDSTYIEDSLLAMGVGIFGILNLIAACIGWCPVYTIAGISSYKPKDT